MSKVNNFIVEGYDASCAFLKIEKIPAANDADAVLIFERKYPEE